MKHVRNINTTIGLSWKVKLILFVFWEQFIKSKNGLHIVFSWSIVIKSTINFRFFWITFRKSNSSRLFYVKNTSFSVPRIFVISEICSSYIHKVRAMLLHKSKHRWATRSTISPKNNWIKFWILLTLQKHIMEIFQRTYI